MKRYAYCAYRRVCRRAARCKGDGVDRCPCPAIGCLENGAAVTEPSLRPRGGAGRNASEPAVQIEHDRGNDRPTKAATVGNAETCSSSRWRGEQTALRSEVGGAVGGMGVMRRTSCCCTGKTATSGQRRRRPGKGYCSRQSYWSVAFNGRPTTDVDAKNHIDRG